MDKIENWIKNKVETNHTSPTKFKQFKQTKKLKIIPLGGLEEIGKNILILEYDNSILVIDMGLQFPEENMLGIDYVIPDISYLEKKKDKIKGVIITHGHLDHIGAIPHLLPRLNFPPIYATKLTIGLIQKRLEEFCINKKAILRETPYKKEIKLGSFSAELFRVNHSIPDGAGVFIRTPIGNLVHTGDFKFDFTPADDKPADFSTIAKYGNEDILAAFLDSTNSKKPGFTPSERSIGKTLDKIIRNAKGRIIISSFSSLISRIQQVIDSCIRYNRKIFISGRSMVDNIDIASKLGYIKAPKGLIRKLSTNINNLPSNQILVLTTGSQGESMSALTRISLGAHSHIKIKPGDTVVLSSSPIVGNERAIYTVINNLCAKGAKVIDNSSMDVHVSGHAHQGDLKLMYSLLKPKYAIPVHGELYMRIKQKGLAEEIGIDPNKVIMMNNGDIVEATRNSMRKSKVKVPANHIVIDGLGVGDIGTQVIRDRKIMANNGVIVVLFRAYEKSGHLVGDPDLISKGFIYVKEIKEIAKNTKLRAKKAYNDAISSNPNISLKDLKYKIKGALTRFFIKRLNREPMILPLIIKV